MRAKGWYGCHDGELQHVDRKHMTLLMRKQQSCSRIVISEFCDPYLAEGYRKTETLLYSNSNPQMPVRALLYEAVGTNPYFHYSFHIMRTNTRKN